MSAFESSYKSLLQGVSQQIPRERLPGQVGAQLNMLSDAVTNIRRRPGAQFKYSLSMPYATTNNIVAHHTDIAGANVHVLINTGSGVVTLLNDAYEEIASLDGAPYLVTANRKNIRVTTVGDELFVLNTAIKPTHVPSSVGVSPDRRGYCFIAAGAFSREYTVTVQTTVGTITASYTTPTGSGGTDAANSTPIYIATQLYNTLNAAKATAGLTKVVRTSAYLYFEGDTGTTNVTVNSSTGNSYVVVSKDAYTTQSGNLPATLPSDANGFIMRVGDLRSPQYYKYDSTSTAWLESGDFASTKELGNMPVSITKVANVWSLVTTNFEGRLAGDDTSNPNPRFMEYGITGIGAYQGRLVLLSGAFARLSSSSKARRFYRSTVTTVLDSDTIEVGSSANSSASYEYAVPFQKDLILFSAKYQALIPSGNQAITPRTATVVLTSTHEADMSCSPVPLGRTLMYPMPRSLDFFGVLEMVPSQYTDSQYISVDSTEHLPKYMGGRCRFAVSSSISGTVLFAPSGDLNSLIVHEYMWDADQKSQRAWHTWTFPYEVAGAYFSNDLINILFVKNGVLVGCTIDPRIGVLDADAVRRPFLDLYTNTSIVDNVVTLPSWMVAFDPTAPDKVSLAVGTGGLAGAEVGFTVEGDTLRTVRSFPSGVVSVGFKYTSLISPTQPTVRDSNEVVISTNKLSILRYMVGTANSSEYKVQVYDRNSPSTYELDVGTLYWSSSELMLGRARNATESIAIVPCRTNANSTVFMLYTDSTGELNLVSLEYVCKYNQKIRRR